jgi:hypothetical protein
MKARNRSKWIMNGCQIKPTDRGTRDWNGGNFIQCPMTTKADVKSSSRSEERCRSSCSLSRWSDVLARASVTGLAYQLRRDENMLRFLMTNQPLASNGLGARIAETQGIPPGAVNRFLPVKASLGFRRLLRRCAMQSSLPPGRRVRRLPIQPWPEPADPLSWPGAVASVKHRRIGSVSSARTGAAPDRGFFAAAYARRTAFDGSEPRGRSLKEFAPRQAIVLTGKYGCDRGGVAVSAEIKERAGPEAAARSPLSLESDATDYSPLAGAIERDET